MPGIFPGICYFFLPRILEKDGIETRGKTKPIDLESPRLINEYIFTIICNIKSYLFNVQNIQ